MKIVCLTTNNDNTTINDNNNYNDSNNDNNNKIIMKCAPTFFFVFEQIFVNHHSDQCFEVTKYFWWISFKLNSFCV